jgi:predicted site-specific integrase-resolvase
MTARELLTVQEAAARYRLDPATLHAWIRAGLLPVVRGQNRSIWLRVGEVDAAWRQRTEKLAPPGSRPHTRW